MLFDFAWVDDFSVARNESIRHATGDWIFWLDADEQVDEINRERLRAVFAGLKSENAAYLMQQLSVTDDPHGSRVAADHVRLFRRDAALRWEYRVHEQILISIRRAVTTLAGPMWSSTTAVSSRPTTRNRSATTRCSVLQAAERPDDPVRSTSLASRTNEWACAAEALPIFAVALSSLPPDYSIRPRLYAAIAAHRNL